LAQLNISALTGLQYLYCDSNNLTTLQLPAALVSLTELNCNDNLLTTLDVSALTQLTHLECGSNNLTSINFGTNDQLEFIICSNNQIGTLNLQGIANLQGLDCSNNLLTNLDLSVVQHLEGLWCDNNQLTELDFTGLTELYELHCMDNMLTELDLSGTYIWRVSFANNNITYLNLKNGHLHDFMNDLENYWGDNPLEYVCADEFEIDVVNDLLESNGYTSVNVNTYCSFTPGGDYNTITGALIFDVNSDGCSFEDVLQSFIKVNLSDGTETTSTFTDASATYAFYTQNGEFTVTPEFENSDYFTVMPETATVEFPVVDNSVETENFCLSANGVHNDVEVIMVPVIPARPGEDAVYKIVYKNKGNQVLSGSVNCLWDYQQFGNVSLTPSPNLQAAGDYTWFYTNLQPFENREIIMTLEVNEPDDATPVDIGDTLEFTATATPLGSDALPQDNEFILNQEVVDSFNANNIICIQGETAAPSMIGEYLHYVINFGNTGNAPANSIVIVVEIDPADFDINTLQMLNSSHGVEVRINGNTIEFIFENVNMAAADHGNILFKLKSRTSLMAGDSVVNNANVYFDYNLPVATNNAVTVFGILNTGDYAVDASVKVYPNPSNGVVNISADTNIESMELYDIQGRLLQSSTVNDAAAQLNITQRASGIYLLKVTTDKGIKVEKIVKE
jgi:hypothetical protein